QALERNWRLHYAVRKREQALLLARFARSDDHINLHVDCEHGGAVMDVSAIVAAAPQDAHLYCCGPAPMLSVLEAACAARAPAHVHIERFSAPDNLAAVGDAYVVKLVRSKRTIAVQAGQTLLQALQSAGVKVRTSC